MVSFNTLLVQNHLVNASITPAPIDQPYRGSGVDRPQGVPLPPAHLPLLRTWQLRKSWHYVSFWSPELSFCAARAKVGPLQQEYWGVWDRAAAEFRQRKHLFTHHIQFETNRVGLSDGDMEIDVTFAEPNSFEVYAPADQAYIWAHKDFWWQARGAVRFGGTTRTVSGILFADIQAGYHSRHTRWRWMAGAGRDQNDRLVAFNVITGMFDSPQNSERAILTATTAEEVGPVVFSDDLSTVTFAEGGSLSFQQEALIEQHSNYLLIRDDYFHAFGKYSGTLPGGIKLREAFGVRENQNALW
jgi:hypothetical protein